MSLYPQDKKAGFLGLIGSVLVLLALVYGMVLLTNSMFEGHEPAAAATHPAPAPAAPAGAAPAAGTPAATSH